MELEPVAAVERLRLELVLAIAGHDLHVLGASVEDPQRFAQIGTGGLSGQVVEKERHRNQHALAEMTDRRQKDWPARQSGIELGLRHVLVLETEPINLEGRAAVAVMRLD